MKYRLIKAISLIEIGLETSLANGLQDNCTNLTISGNLWTTSDKASELKSKLNLLLK